MRQLTLNILTLVLSSKEILLLRKLKLRININYPSGTKGGTRNYSTVTSTSNVIIYSNLGEDKKSMLEDNREKSGIYM
jgi:hypothetical protein